MEAISAYTDIASPKGEFICTSVSFLLLFGIALLSVHPDFEVAAKRWSP